MIGSSRHSELRDTIREYTTDDGGFDFESVLDLVLAGIDNLAENSTEEDFQGQNRLTEKQADFLRHLFLRLMPAA
ncbi:MAG: hypothetical protein P8165_14955 [Deltaproteobacteria bacterium]|jgi:hypothetical protein